MYQPTNPFLDFQLCKFPQQYVSVGGLLCLKGNVQTKDDGEKSINQLHLCKFYYKEVTGKDGKIYSQLQEPKWPLKISLNEAEALIVKLDHMIKEARAMNEERFAWVSSLALAVTVRRKYHKIKQGRETSDENCWMQMETNADDGSDHLGIRDRYQFGGEFGAIGSSHKMWIENQNN